MKSDTCSVSSLSVIICVGMAVLTLLYDNETWVLRQKDHISLVTAEMAYLRTKAVQDWIVFVIKI